MNTPIFLYEGDDSYTFVSYCHKDKERVYPVISELYSRGCRIWYDDGIDPGTEWPEVIAQHLGNCGACIAFVSENSLCSHNCRNEINYAVMKQRPLLIVMLDDAKLSPGMEMQLSTMQSVLAYREDIDTAQEILKWSLLSSCMGKASFTASDADRTVLQYDNAPSQSAATGVMHSESLLLIRTASKAPLSWNGALSAGRAEDCGYPITDNKNVSGHHAEFINENGRLFVRDLGSTNGTFLNGTRLTAYNIYELRYGDSVMLGDEHFVAAYSSIKARAYIECIRTGKGCAVNDGQLFVGADPELCALVIDDNRFVGKQHLMVSADNNNVYISDNRSTNGTYIDGARLSADTPARLDRSKAVKVADEYLFISILHNEAEGS